MRSRLLTALLLAACGGSNPGSGAVVANPTRGQLLQSPPELVSTVTAPALLLALNALANQQLLAISGTPLCDIAVHRIRYATVGGANEATTASGALMVPLGGDPHCRGTRPILLYAHGTTTDRAFDMTNLQGDPNGEALDPGGALRIAGLHRGRAGLRGLRQLDTALPPLPGRRAAVEGHDRRADRRTQRVADRRSTGNDGQRPAVHYRLLAGWLRGDGDASRHAGRRDDGDGIGTDVRALRHGGFRRRGLFGSGQFRRDGVSHAAVTAYQKAYGNIYSGTTDVFEAQYASGIESLLPSTTPRSALYAQGKLPRDALFSATPPDPAFADITPATTPANLAPIFARGFGPDHLVTNSFRLTYILDARANPDGGWPTTTNGIAAATPGIRLRQALKQNDLRTWIPAAPTLLCGGNADPTVFWFNTQLMQGYWAARAPSPSPVVVLDLDSTASGGDPYADLKSRFVLAKQIAAATAVAQGARDGGASAVADAYHAGLVPPFCLAAVESFFAAH